MTRRAVSSHGHLKGRLCRIVNCSLLAEPLSHHPKKTCKDTTDIFEKPHPGIASLMSSARIRACRLQIPGPGAYMPRNAAECSGSNGMFRSSPQHSLAGKHSSIWNVNKNVASLPGPGAYSRSAVSGDLSKPKSPSWHFGVCKDRSSFVHTNMVPGASDAHNGRPHASRTVASMRSSLCATMWDSTVFVVRWTDATPSCVRSPAVDR